VPWNDCQEDAMTERPRIFDDLAGVAGGAVSALMGLKDEAEALARARIDEAIRRLDLVRREEFEAVRELAANARTGQEVKLAAMEARIAALEEKSRPAGGGGPGMIV
jgi:BMFP domain-containing protein YqiC